jgi:hypothetical protein
VRGGRGLEQPGDIAPKVDAVAVSDLKFREGLFRVQDQSHAPAGTQVVAAIGDGEGEGEGEGVAGWQADALDHAPMLAAIHVVSHGQEEPVGEVGDLVHDIPADGEPHGRTPT